MCAEQIAVCCEVPCILPNEKMFKGVVLINLKTVIWAFLSLPGLFFTVTTLLWDAKLKLLSINNLDLDKVACLKACRQLALSAVGLSLTVSATVTSPVIDASL